MRALPSASPGVKSYGGRWKLLTPARRYVSANSIFLSNNLMALNAGIEDIELSRIASLGLFTEFFRVL